MLSLINKIISLIPTGKVHADALGEIVAGQINNVTQQQDLTGLVNALVSLSVPLGVLAAMALMSYAGYVMITSQGNPEKLGEAREVATNAIIGFALIALSVAILLLIQNTLNIPGIQP
ncbi:hypothetical protein IT417_03815 [bacterium]|nr:hypothetical protein [bacterium]